MPVYNGAQYLDLAVQSIVSQTYEDFELVISDNSSTDDSLQIAQNWTARDHRIVTHHNDKNLGGAANFNRVLDLARGEFFRWASHDDRVHPEMVTACVQALDAEGPECVLVYPRTMIIDAEGNDVGLYEDRLDLRQEDPAHRLRTLIRNFRLANPVFGLIRIDALRSVNGLPRFNSGDFVMLAGLALRGRFVELPEVLFFRRLHDGMSWKASKSPEGFATWFDTSRNPVIVYPMWRVWRELFFEVGRWPASRSNSLRAAAIVFTEWPKRHWRRLLGEIVRTPRVIGRSVFRLHELWHIVVRGLRSR